MCSVALPPENCSLSTFSLPHLSLSLSLSLPLPPLSLFLSLVHVYQQGRVALDSPSYCCCLCSADDMLVHCINIQEGKTSDVLVFEKAVYFPTLHTYNM